MSRLATKNVDCSVACPMCDLGTETFSHFVTECPLLRSVVALSSLQCKFQQINMESYGDLFAYIGRNWSRYERDLWMTMMWMTWDA